MKNILVTGCAGFIGSALSKSLLDKGFKVVGIDNFDPYYDINIKLRNISALQDEIHFTFYQTDIANTLDINRILSSEPVDLIIHLAARAGVRPSLEQPLLYEEVNSKGTLYMLDAARKAGIKHFTLASSSSVYGEDFGSKATEEHHTTHPISPYAASKKSAELYAYSYYINYGININILRFFTAYGPSQRPDMAFQKFIRSIYNHQPIDLYGGLKMGRDFTFIDDVVNGIISSLNYFNGYEIFNIGSGKEIKVIDVIELLGKYLGIKPIINVIEKQPGDPSFTLADISKAKRLLNYYPRTSTEEGIKIFVDWVVRNNILESEKQ